MPYIGSNGKIIEKRSIFRLSIFSEIIWGVVNIIGLFFDTLINPKKQIKKAAYTPSSTSNKSDGRGSGVNTRKLPRGTNIKGVDSVRACTPRG